MKTDKIHGKLKGNQTWIRVHGRNLQSWHDDRHIAAVELLKSQSFKDMCSNAGIEATNRQARKYNNGKGAAWKTAHRVHMNGFSVQEV